MSGRMSPEEMRAFGVIVAGLVEAKVTAAMEAATEQMRTMLATAGNAGHAAITRAGQVEDRLDDHEWRLRRLERDHGLDHRSPVSRFEDEFPVRSAGE